MRTHTNIEHLNFEYTESIKRPQNCHLFLTKFHYLNMNGGQLTSKCQKNIYHTNWSSPELPKFSRYFIVCRSCSNVKISETHGRPQWREQTRRTGTVKIENKKQKRVRRDLCVSASGCGCLSICDILQVASCAVTCRKMSQVFVEAYKSGVTSVHEFVSVPYLPTVNASVLLIRFVAFRSLLAAHYWSSDPSRRRTGKKIVGISVVLFMHGNHRVSGP